MNSKTVAIILAGLSSAFAQLAAGQELTTPKVSDAAIDLSVPESPAFTVLGLTPNDVARPTSPREFATSLLNGIDGNGNFQTGVALDASPYMLLFGETTTLEDYESNPSVKLMSRTQVSFATAKGASDNDEAVRLAVGLRLTPWDEGDPRLDKDLIECLKNAVGKVKIEVAVELEELLDRRNLMDKMVERTTDEVEKEQLKTALKDLNARADALRKAGSDELNEKSAKEIENCRSTETFRSNLWNKSGWALGIAPTFTSTSGNSDDFDDTGVAIWTSLALRLGNVGQAILHTRYRAGEEVPVNSMEGVFFEQDSLRFGGRLRFGTPSLAVNLETSYIMADRKDGQRDDNIVKYSGNVDFRIASNLWLTFNLGSEASDKNGNDVFVLGNFKWAFAPGPTQKF